MDLYGHIRGKSKRGIGEGKKEKGRKGTEKKIRKKENHANFWRGLLYEIHFFMFPQII